MQNDRGAFAAAVSGGSSLATRLEALLTEQGRLTIELDRLMPRRVATEPMHIALCIAGAMMLITPILGLLNKSILTHSGKMDAKNAESWSLITLILVGLCVLLNNLPPAQIPERAVEIQTRLDAIELEISQITRQLKQGSRAFAAAAARRADPAASADDPSTEPVEADHRRTPDPSN